MAHFSRTTAKKRTPGAVPAQRHMQHAHPTTHPSTVQPKYSAFMARDRCPKLYSELLLRGIARIRRRHTGQMTCEEHADTTVCRGAATSWWSKSGRMGRHASRTCSESSAEHRLRVGASDVGHAGMRAVDTDYAVLLRRTFFGSPTHIERSHDGNCGVRARTAHG